MIFAACGRWPRPGQEVASRGLVLPTDNWNQDRAFERWYPLKKELACGGGGAARPAVASVSLTASRTGPLTSLGDTIQITAVPLDASGVAISGVTVAFTSSVELVR